MSGETRGTHDREPFDPTDPPGPPFPGETRDNDDLRAAIAEIAASVWRVGCDCGHTVISHKSEFTTTACVGGLSMCRCRRGWPSIVADRLRAALAGTGGGE